MLQRSSASTALSYALDHSTPLPNWTLLPKFSSTLLSAPDTLLLPNNLDLSDKSSLSSTPSILKRRRPTPIPRTPTPLPPLVRKNSPFHFVPYTLISSPMNHSATSHSASSITSTPVMVSSTPTFVSEDTLCAPGTTDISSTTGTRASTPELVYPSPAYSPPPALFKLDIEDQDSDMSLEEGEILPELDLPGLTQLDNLLHKEVQTDSKVGVAASILREFLLKQFLHQKKSKSATSDGSNAPPSSPSVEGIALNLLEFAATAKAAADVLSSEDPSSSDDTFASTYEKADSTSVTSPSSTAASDPRQKKFSFADATKPSLWTPIGQHPGKDWTINCPGTAGYYPFPIPDAGHVIDASYVKFDLSPSYPQILGTHGKGLPVHYRLLRAKRSVTPAGPYSRQQIRLFDPSEPFNHWVLDALVPEGDKSLTASPRHYMWQRDQIRSTEAQLAALMSQMGRLTNDAQESLRDLELANAFARLTDQIDWSGNNNKSNNPEAHEAYIDTTRDAYNFPDVTPPVLDHKDKRCHRCGIRGHIRAKCPNRKKPYTKKGKNAKYWKD